MGIPRLHNVGAFINPVIAHAALANAAGTRTGSAIDRRGYESCVLSCNVGITTGSPDAQTYDCKLQDSADGSTGWADITGAAITQKTTATAAVVGADVNLAGAARYIRVVEVVGFTNGSSPKTPAAVTVILGGPIQPPV